jgi:hypothetical protein
MQEKEEGKKKRSQPKEGKKERKLLVPPEKGRGQRCWWLRGWSFLLRRSLSGLRSSSRSLYGRGGLRGCCRLACGGSYGWRKGVI